MANSLDPDQTAGSTLFASTLNLSVMLGNYLQQTTSADDIFRCIFLGALKVKKNSVNPPESLIMGHYIWVFTVFQLGVTSKNHSPFNYPCGTDR